MYKYLITLVLTLFTCASHAYDCLPTTWVPIVGTGSPVRTVTTSYGYVKTWWCKLPARQGDAAGKEYWRRQIFMVHNTDQNLTAFAAAAGRVASAADPMKQANLEFVANYKVTTPGTQKAYEYDQLWYLGCKDLQANLPANLDSPKPAEIADWCGDPPVAPISVDYKTISTIAYNTTSGGLVNIAGTITRGLTCDCTSPLKIGTATYCTFTGAAKPTIRASCAKP